MRANLNLRIAVVFLAFFRARFAFFARYENADDGCYLHWLNNFVGLPPEGCLHGSYLPGAALLWLPAGFLGRCLSVLTTVPHRVFFDVFIGFIGFACWGIALHLLHEMDRKRAWLFLLNLPVLYYCTSHTHIAHAAELLLCVLFLLAIERREFVAAAALTVWLSLTRLNDVGVVLVLLGALADEGKITRTAIAVTVAVSAFAVAMGFWFGYNHDTLPVLLARTSWNRIYVVFLGQETGMVYSQSYFLFLLGWGLYRWRALNWAARGALAWFVLTLYFVAVMYHGNDFGQRYTIGASLALFLVHRRAPGRWWCVLGAVWMTLQTWVYQTPPYEVDMQVRTWLRLAHPINLVTGIPLTPIGTIVYSLYHDASWLAFMPRLPRLALNGVRFWALVVATCGATLVCFAPSLWVGSTVLDRLKPLRFFSYGKKRALRGLDSVSARYWHWWRDRERERS